MIKIYTFSSAYDSKTNKEVFKYETTLEIQEWEKSFYSNYTTLKPDLEKLKDNHIYFDKVLEMWIYQPFNDIEEESTNETSNITDELKEAVIEEKPPKKTKKKA